MQERPTSIVAERQRDRARSNDTRVAKEKPTNPQGLSENARATGSNRDAVLCFHQTWSGRTHLDCVHHPGEIEAELEDPRPGDGERLERRAERTEDRPGKVVRVEGAHPEGEEAAEHECHRAHAGHGKVLAQCRRIDVPAGRLISPTVREG